MLQFLLGGAKTGKSSALCQRAEQLADANRKVIFLVPEQFTFETEKKLFCDLGGERYRCVNVTSFTRLATEIFKAYGGVAGQYADDSAKSVIMELAVLEVRDKLSVYEKSAGNKTFVPQMLATVTELKCAGITPQKLSECANDLDGFLQDKLRETALLYGTYDALLQQSYLDPLDDLSRAAERVRGTDFFTGCTVILDEFKGFTEAELNFCKLLLPMADDVMVSLCMDYRRARISKNGVFADLMEVYQKLVRFARESGVSVQKPTLLENSHFEAPELSYMEQNLFAPVIMPYSDECSAISAILCRDEYDEVEYALSTIAHLVQDEGFRYSQITVISRDLNTYFSKLEAGFRKYRIPYYSDRAAPIADKPLIRFVENLLFCLTSGASTEHILSLLKCGVTPFSLEDISELENYVYVWNVSAKQWQKEFSQNPRGFEEKISEEDQELLKRINAVRSYVSNGIEKLRKAVKDAGGKDFCGAVFEFIEKMQIRETIEKRMSDCYHREEYAAGDEYRQVWDAFVGILDKIASCTGEKKISPEVFLRLFELAKESSSLGSLPQGADTVSVGSAERIRVSGKRAVFVLGVNENVLPYLPAGGGVFTDRERERLQALDLHLAKPSSGRIQEEWFIAYKTLCSPSERLYLTARKADVSGAVLAPSLLFRQLARMFGKSVISDSSDLPAEYYCRSGDAAFSILAGHYSEDTAFVSSLREVFLREKEYTSRTQALQHILEPRSFSLQKSENALSLFGKTMYISPTRVESFYQCRFRYFVEHGLRVLPLRQAQLDPMASGTLIHYVLCTVMQQMDMKENYDTKKAQQLIQEVLDSYIESVMGGVFDKTNRFLYLYRRMQKSILKVVEQLHAELVQSDFSPCDYEYEIKDGSDIPPLKLQSTDGTTICIHGKIDRIDRYISKNGEKYIRIIDYKSGKKTFRLSDVLYGLNLQMLIYLDCICQNGKGEYQDSKPAGILYMPVGEKSAALPRNADEETLKRAKAHNYAMNGLLLNHLEVLKAMEPSVSGVFIPVSVKKDGDFTAAAQNSLVTLAELAHIDRYLNKLVLDMAQELHHGQIDAVPLEGSCDYCDYRGICGISKETAALPIENVDRKETLEEMKKACADTK